MPMEQIIEFKKYFLLKNWIIINEVVIMPTNWPISSAKVHLVHLSHGHVFHSHCSVKLINWIRVEFEEGIFQASWTATEVDEIIADHLVVVARANGYISTLLGDFLTWNHR